MKYQNDKLNASFELPEDLTFGQLESYEKGVTSDVNAADTLTDAVVWMAAMRAALEVGFFKPIKGLPMSADELNEAKAAPCIWAAREISKYVIAIKTADIDPN